MAVTVAPGLQIICLAVGRMLLDCRLIVCCLLYPFAVETKSRQRQGAVQESYHLMWFDLPKTDMVPVESMVGNLL